MSAIELERHDAPSSGSFWRDPARRAEVFRQHALPCGLALVIGALLRLLWLGDTSFLGDQAQLLAVGSSAARRHAFILTGIPSSLGALNPPISTWLYGPFALLGGALGATIFTSLANVAAIFLLYAIAVRYFGRRAAFVAALLYATTSGPVHYARFIWQQNLLAPIVLLLFWLILRAVVERQSGWLGWSVLLWGIATGLHPTAAPLVGLIVIALAFTWRDLRWRDIALAVAALLALFGPTLLWEALSHGYDLAGAQRFSQGHAVVDTWALTYLLQLTQPAPAAAYGTASGYAAIGRAIAPLGGLIEALVIVSQVWLLAILSAPWLRARTTSIAAVAATARVALADACWRVALCLALWEALPLAFMLRHSRPVEIHYLLVLLPAIYLCMGAALAWASGWLQRSLSQRAELRAWARGLALGALVVVVAGVSVAQTIGVVGELATIQSGAFDALTLPLHYGTPLSSQRDALSVSQSSARRLHATLAIASTRVQQEPLGYLNATISNAIPATDYISQGCVALPTASALAPLVTLAVPGSTAAQLLPLMQGAQHIGSIAVKGGPAYQLYALTPGASLASATLLGAPAESGQPQAAAYTYTPAAGGGATLTIRWVGAPNLKVPPANAVSYWYGADPKATTPIADYTFTAQPLDAQGQPIGAPLTTVCSRLAWSSHLSLITTTHLPAALAASGKVAGWRVSSQVAPAVALRPTFGPLALETGAITFGPAQPLGPAVTFAAP